MRNVPHAKRDQLITVGTAYRPPGQPVAFWETFSSAVDHVIARNDKTIILGDFNVDVLKKTSPQYGHLRQHCQEFCLRNVVTQPTRLPSGTCLDIALCSDDLKTSACHAIALHGITDHQLVLVKTVLPMTKPTRVVRQLRKPPLWKLPSDECTDSMLDALTDSAFRRVPPDGSPDVNTMATSFSILCKSVLNEKSPVKQITISARAKRKPQPWVSDQLRRLLERRKHLHAKVLKHPGNESVKQQ